MRLDEIWGPRAKQDSTGVRAVRTRFRAYQLGIPGSSFSYFAGAHFTLIEGMATDLSRPRIQEELKACGKASIDTLHITSWDKDHCSEDGLAWVLSELEPKRVEYPGYDPGTDCGKGSLKLLTEYEARRRKKQLTTKLVAIHPDYIKGLKTAADLEYEDIVYHPKQLVDCSNDNSTVKLFRGGCFNVLSLGDVEDPAIAAMLRRDKALKREVDVMILAHHGADNGFTTKKFLEDIDPKVAICTSDYGNMYDHPRQEIRDILHELDIRLFTTKTGDVVIESMGGHRRDYVVTNYKSDSSAVSSKFEGKAKKYHFLSMNRDSLENILSPGRRGR